jgi:hypothetical protein
MARLQVDSQHVVHEAIDGETLVVQLATGAYYSLRGTAHEAWEMLAARQPIDTVADQLADRYPEATDVADDVRRFADELRGEELLIEYGPGEADPGGPGLTGDRAVATYEPPRVERYTDMQYFLLLDPIHEVDHVAGWPHAAASGELPG